MKDINFLFSESIVDKMEDTEKKKKGISTGKIILVVLVLFIAVGVLLAPGLYLSSIKAQVEKAEASLLDPKYVEVRSVKSKLESTTAELNKKKSIINDIDSKSLASSQALLMVEQAAPLGCYFSSLSYSGSDLKLSGKADSSRIVSELISNLDRLHTLKRISESVSLEQDQSPVNYNISYSVSVKGGK